MEGNERCRRYAVRQGLTAPRGRKGLVEMVEQLCGVQEQIPGNTFPVARARSQRVSLGEVQAELYDRRRLAKTWALRGTVHVVAAADLPLYWQALRPEWEARWSAYLDRHATREQRGMAARASLEVLKGGPATRSQLLAGAQELLETKAEWLTHLFSSWGGVLKDLAYQGEVVYGPRRGAEVCFVRPADWLGTEAAKAPGREPDEALSALLVRYLQAYGPATVQDFAYWSGVTVTRARRARQLAADRVCPAPETPSGPGGLLDVPLASLREEQDVPTPVAFLPKFDPYVLAHKDKFYLPTEHYKQVFRPAADVAAVVVVDGRIAGTWRREGQGRTRRVAVSLFGSLTPDGERRIEEEAGRFATPDHLDKPAPSGG